MKPKGGNSRGRAAKKEASVGGTPRLESRLTTRLADSVSVINVKDLLRPIGNRESSGEGLKGRNFRGEYRREKLLRERV